MADKKSQQEENTGIKQWIDEEEEIQWVDDDYSDHVSNALDLPFVDGVRICFDMSPLMKGLNVEQSEKIQELFMNALEKEMNELKENYGLEYVKISPEQARKDAEITDPHYEALSWSYIPPGIFLIIPIISIAIDST